MERLPNGLQFFVAIGFVIAERADRRHGRCSVVERSAVVGSR
jgi:hypothetical protein